MHASDAFRFELESVDEPSQIADSKSKKYVGLGGVSRPARRQSRKSRRRRQSGLN
jgi:hypothetical protein